MGISWTSKNWVKKHDFPWGSKEFHGIFYGNTSGEEPYEHMDIIYWLLYVIIIWYSYIYTHVYSIYIYNYIYWFLSYRVHIQLSVPASSAWVLEITRHGIEHGLVGGFSPYPEK